MKELRELETDEGMQLDIPEIPTFFLHGTLLSVCTDMKGAHEIEESIYD